MHHHQQNSFLREMNGPSQGKGITIWRGEQSVVDEDIGRFDVVAYREGIFPHTDAHEATR